ncbi:MAG: Maf family protein, partial [Proteobacteria bacterium]|nr:Maf family protein [Pseudomonadota bacterium]
MAADYTPQAGCCQNAMLSKTNIGDMAKPHKKLILASTSAYRAQLLDRLLVSYQQVSPHVDEKRILNERYADLAARLSEEKASGVTESHCLVIGSDQVAVLDNEQLHKPGSVAKAKAQLAKASEK